MEGNRIRYLIINWQDENYRNQNKQFTNLEDFFQFLLDEGLFSEITVERQYLKKEQPIVDE